MSSFQPEWNAFIAQHTNLRHDDPERNSLFLSSPAGNELSAQVSTVDTTVPGKDNHQIPIRIYTAKATRSSSGIVIFFHSGGFTCGSLETEDVSCRYMALGGPITVISVDYRLSPEYVYPIPLEDGWNAAQYIMSNLSSLVQIHTTPVNLVLSGTSSGGQLAAIVSHRAGSWLSAAENSGHAARISFSGVLLRAPVSVRGTDTEFIPPRFRDLHRSWLSDYKGAELNRMSMIRNHDALGVPFNKTTSPDAYPLWSELNGLPRTYIQICELDILRDDAVCYVRGLRDAGVEVRETLYKGLPHIFWIYAHHLDVSMMAQEDCVQGLRWLLGIPQ